MKVVGLFQICLMKKIFCLLYFLLVSIVLFAQRNPDETYMPQVKGIKLFVHGEQMTYPIINLGSTSTLELHFDDLDGNIKNYSYTYQLCDAGWQPIDLNPLDYLQGFTQNRLNQYRVSSIAKVKYIHYQAILPERNCIPTKSGNYLLKVFLNGDTSRLAFTRRMLVLDNKVPIALKVMQPYNSQLMTTYQKVQFSIDKTSLNILNPQQQLKVVVLQNYRWDNAATNLQPVFMRQNIYEYNGEKDCLFPAGKEYRWADLRSFRYQSERIDNINSYNTPFDVYMRPDPQRIQERMLVTQDYDGFYAVSATDVNNPWWQGDYANVHFTFRTGNQQPIAGKDVFILGEMTGNALNDSTKLKFNTEKGAYEISLLLKQGYYNYTYVTKDAKTKNAKPEMEFTEGDYWETENSYTVLVYYRSLGDRYDALLGVATVNSRFGKQ